MAKPTYNQKTVDRHIDEAVNEITIWQYAGLRYNDSNLLHGADINAVTRLAGHEKTVPEVNDIVYCYDDGFFWGIAEVISVWSTGVDLYILGRNLTVNGKGLVLDGYDLKVDVDGTTLTLTGGKVTATPIAEKIPEEATALNQLADKAYVGSMISAQAADPVFSDAAGSIFISKAALVAGPWFIHGVSATPEKNDWATVESDETYGGAMVRYYATVDASGSFNGWAFAYKVGTLKPIIEAWTKEQLPQVDWTPDAGTQIVVWNSPKTAAGVRLEVTDLKKGYLYAVMAYASESEVFDGGYWYLDGDGNVQQIGNNPKLIVDQMFFFDQPSTASGTTTTVAGVAQDIVLRPEGYSNPVDETWVVPKGSTFKFNEGGSNPVNFTVNETVSFIPEHNSQPTGITFNLTPDASTTITGTVPLYGKREQTQFDKRSEDIPDDLQDLTTIPSTASSEGLSSGIKFSEFYFGTFCKAQMQHYLDMTDDALAAEIAMTIQPPIWGEVELYLVTGIYGEGTTNMFFADPSGGSHLYNGGGIQNSFFLPAYGAANSPCGSSSATMIYHHWGPACAAGKYTSGGRACWPNDLDFAKEIKKFMRYCLSRNLYSNYKAGTEGNHTWNGITIYWRSDTWGTVRYYSDAAYSEPYEVEVYEHINESRTNVYNKTVKCWR